MLRDDLLIPGSIPGLLRRGSPVVFYSVRDAVAVTVSGVVVDVGPDRATVASADRALVGSRALMDLSLDLSDATGRAHAAWWLSRGCWEGAPDGDPSARTIYWRARETWSGDPVPTLFLSTPEFGRGDILWTLSRVPTLADLDPTSDERLPDGSRLVDALALARVVLARSGVAS